MQVANKKGRLGKKKLGDLIANLMRGAVKAEALVKRYDKFSGNKDVDFEEFYDFYKSVAPNTPNELQVVVVKADNLRAADRSLFGSGKRC